MMFTLTDVLSEGVWPLYEKLQDPQLVKLKEALVQTVMKSRADSTIKKYLYAFQRWREWVKEKPEITAFPVQWHQFALYLQYLANEVKSKAAVEEVLNAASWAMQSALEGSHSAPIIQATVAGLQRLLAKLTTKKEPITLDLLRQMVQTSGTPPSLVESRLLAICLLAFSAFLRIDEVISIRCCDIKFEKDYMSIHLMSSKTDQYRQGADIVVIHMGSELCPVLKLQEYYSIAKLDPNSSEKLFRGIVASKNGDRLRSTGSISYSRVRELVLRKIESLGHDPKLFSLHSFRSGGCVFGSKCRSPRSPIQKTWEMEVGDSKRWVH